MTADEGEEVPEAVADDGHSGPGRGEDATETPPVDDDLRIDGLSLREAVDEVREHREADEPTVRKALAVVAEDDVVGWEAAEDELAHVSKVVTTAETRTELARIALSDASDEADRVPDLDVVRSRLASFEADVAAVEERASDLGEELQSVVKLADEATDLYGVALGLREVTAAANRVQRAADELSVELEEFERWLSSPEARVDELRADVDAFEAALEDLEGDVDAVSDESGSSDDPGARWADATIRHRTMGLMLADVRAELDGLREWADVEGVDHDGELEGLEERLGSLAADHEALGERLDGAATPRWTERFGDRVATVESSLDEFAPPVDWGTVRAVIDDHSPGSGDGE